jgi:integrase
MEKGRVGLGRRVTTAAASPSATADRRRRAQGPQQRGGEALHHRSEAAARVSGALHVSGLLFVTDDAGKPIPPTEFRHRLRAHLNRIELTDRHFHGLRHATATALAELGGSDAEIQALLGHQTRQMAERHTKKARQRRLAGSAVKKLEDGWDIG